MTVSWMSVLQNVPWGNMVSNAPKVTAGASKLWKTVAMKLPQKFEKFDGRPTAISLETQGIAALKTRVLELETATVDLRERMIDSSALIRALAEQNTQLISCIECLRLYLFWLTVLISVVGVAVAIRMCMTLAI